jgi:hypothetical protein
MKRRGKGVIDILKSSACSLAKPALSELQGRLRACCELQFSRDIKSRASKYSRSAKLPVGCKSLLKIVLSQRLET